MRTLERFVAENPGYCGVVPTTAEECEPFFWDLESRLSPENLNQDGETDCTDAIANGVFYQNVWRELEIICGENREMFV